MHTQDKANQGHPAYLERRATTSLATRTTGIKIIPYQLRLLYIGYLVDLYISPRLHMLDSNTQPSTNYRSNCGLTCRHIPTKPMTAAVAQRK